MSQPPDTPGRRSKRIETLPKYNARPKDVGTRTGAKMPVNVARDSLGFEKADAFFMTPGGMTEAPGTAQTIRTFASASVMKSGNDRMSIGSVGTYLETPAPRGGRHRLSRLAAADSEDEDGSGIGRDILNEDDEPGLDAHLSSPSAWYTTNETPKVPLPPASALPPPSPAVDYENIPTPQRRNRKSKTGVAREAVSPAKSTYSHVDFSPAKSTTSSRQVMDELDIDMEMANLEDEGINVGDVSTYSVQRSPSVGASSAKKSRKSRAPIGDEEDDEEEEEVEEHTPKPAKKRPGRQASVHSEDGNRENGSPRRVPAESQDVGVDQSFDMGIDDDTGVYGGDDYDNEPEANGDYDDDDHDNGPVHYDDDVSMEEAAVAAENGSQSEEDENDRVVVKRVKSKTARVSPAPRKAKRGPRAISSRPVERKSRVSGIGGDGEGFTGDFTTRSGRKHIKPLEYWRGEKVNYGRGPGLAVIKEVVRIDDEPKKPIQRKNRGRSQSAKPSQEGGNEEDGWDDETEPVGIVTEFATGREIQRRVAFPAHRLDPKQVAGSQFRYQKVFGEDQFIASGVVYIPEGCSKPAKQSKDNSYVFFVITGAVQVTVHKTSFVMAPGGMFMVPRGNEYKIENISKKEVQLFFAQARKIRMNEADEQAFEDFTEASRPRSASIPNVKQSRASVGTEGSDDSESEED